MYFNTTGSNNIAVGRLSLSFNLSGNSNVAFGNGALRQNIGGSNNFAAGNNTLISNTYGYSNVAIGNLALNNNTIGFDNIAMGDSALLANTSGQKNIALNVGALQSNQTGINNVSLGFQTLFFNVTGSNNIAQGLQALAFNNAEHNTAIGFQTLFNNTIGIGNIAIGNQALRTNTGGNYNVGIGWGQNASSATVSNEVNIGNGSVVARFQGAASAWSFVSDVRDKTNIQPLEIGIDFVNQLKPRKFEWNIRECEVDKGKPAIGFIAQELLDCVESNNVQYTNLVDTNDKDKYTVAQTNLIPVLVKAIQELSTQLSEVKNQLITLKNVNNTK
jgi:hypothetical protein